MRSNSPISAWTHNKAPEFSQPTGRLRPGAGRQDTLQSVPPEVSHLLLMDLVPTQHVSETVCSAKGRKLSAFLDIDTTKQLR